MDWETLGTIKPTWNLKFRDQSRRRSGKTAVIALIIVGCPFPRQPLGGSQFNPTNTFSALIFPFQTLISGSFVFNESLQREAQLQAN